MLFGECASLQSTFNFDMLLMKLLSAKTLTSRSSSHVRQNSRTICHSFTLKLWDQEKTTNQTNLQVHLVNLRVSSFYVRSQRGKQATWKKKMQAKQLVKITLPNSKRQQKTKAPQTFLSVTQTGHLSKNYHQQRGAGTSDGQILSN